MRRLALRRKCHACKKVLDNGNGGPGHPMRKVKCLLCGKNFCLDCVEFLGRDGETARKENGVGLACKTCRAELALTQEEESEGLVRTSNLPHLMLGPGKAVPIR